MKKVLITGITGQDGSYLAELLLNKGYEIHGIIRRSSSFNTGRIDHIYDKISLHYGDMTDSLSLERILQEVKPDEVYHLAAQTHVRASFDIPDYTGQVDAMGSLRLFEGVRRNCPNTKVYNACHDLETKVVAEKGIVDYNELKNGDMVYTFNTTSQKMELKPIKKIIEYKYNGKMIHFKSRRIDQLVTPNHSMIFKKDNGELFYIESEKVLNELKYDNISHLSLPIPIPNKKDKIEYIYFSDYVDFSEMSKNHTKNNMKKMKMDDFLYLLGCYIGDGYMKNNFKNCVKTSNYENYKYREKNGRFDVIETEVVEKEYESSYINFAIPETDTERDIFI
jgi:hypothetical protein